LKLLPEKIAYIVVCGLVGRSYLYSNMEFSIDSNMGTYISVLFTVALLITLCSAATGGAAAASTPVITDRSTMDIGTIPIAIEAPPEPLQAESTPPNDTEQSADLPPPKR